MKQTKVTRSARGKDCTLHIKWVCNFDPATTVFAHTGSGTGKRKIDKGCYACSDCHDAIDYRSTRFLDNDAHLQDQLHAERLDYIARAEKKTERLLAEQGLAA